VCYSMRYKSAIVIVVPTATQSLESYTYEGLDLTTRIDVFIGRAGTSLYRPDDANGVY